MESPRYVVAGKESLIRNSLVRFISFRFVEGMRTFIPTQNGKQFVSILLTCVSIYPTRFRFSLPLGPGTVFLQSMSIDKLRALFPPQTNDGGGGGGE